MQKQFFFFIGKLDVRKLRTGTVEEQKHFFLRFAVFEDQAVDDFQTAFNLIKLVCVEHGVIEVIGDFRCGICQCVFGVADMLGDV